MILHEFKTNIKRKCPNCVSGGKSVSAITIKAQLKNELLNTFDMPMELFNFCTNPQCDTVYYSDNGTKTFFQSDIKSKVTIKNNNPKTPLCYCNNILKEDVIKRIEDKEPNIANSIKNILTKNKSFCIETNPQGSCCTNNIKIFLKDYGINWEEKKVVVKGLEAVKTTSKIFV